MRHTKTRFSIHDLFIQLQLQQLMETLNATEPHYIRCVKPNNLLKPAIFENQNIMQQLRCGVSYFDTSIYYKMFGLLFLCIRSIWFQGCLFIGHNLLVQGVLEAIRISCAGYPTRRPFFEFLNRFGLLAPEALQGRQCTFQFICLRLSSVLGVSISYLTCIIYCRSIADITSYTVVLYSGGELSLLYYLTYYSVGRIILAMSKFFLMRSYDEKLACQKILEKKGIKGFQV